MRRLALAGLPTGVNLIQQPVRLLLDPVPGSVLAEK